jgi:hypothetical protein
MFWLGRQVYFGLVLGALCSGCSIFFLLIFREEEGLSGDIFASFVVVLIYIILPTWPVISVLAAFFGWGFGFGFWWYFNLLGFAIVVVGGLGLAASLVIWKEAKRV